MSVFVDMFLDFFSPFDRFHILGVFKIPFMRFKKGDKVEVMRKKEVPVWRCGEIISGNGHTYSVKYDCNPAQLVIL